MDWCTIKELRVRVTLQLTVSQSVCLGVEPRLGFMTRLFIYLFLVKVTVLLIWGALSDEKSGLSLVSQSFVVKSLVSIYIQYRCGISQLNFHADNECKNEAKAQIVTC
jgi:hypothetical protein